MSPSLCALFCLGLCLGWLTRAHNSPLPKPSLQALPHSLVPLEKPVTILCQGPPDVDLYRLEKLRSGMYKNEAVLFIPAMKQSFAGRYRCSYQNGSRWSPPSDQLELVATGVFDKPSLSAQPSPVVSTGGVVTLQCRSKYGFDHFALYKKGDAGLYKGSERWYQANFPITTAMPTHSGTYQCYSFSSISPYLWSAPSDPLELVVTGTSATPSQLPTETPSSVTEPSRNITIFPKGSGSPTGLAGLQYSRGNLVRICLGAAVLILLAGLLAEDWHSRKKPLLHRVGGIHRPLPTHPQTQKSHSRQDRGRPDSPKHGGHC
ncbi:platelet glycoprotein VI isoform X1 [Rousettus aegyptiacus]|uniref:Glycoprotein VI platelet n=1 Tax=Rousettus aegyptiacus TaxID=9407 RepID=A0A7J8CGG0_ROUAE|nr:platelet glycoprotein VI isoform X1 [Rousettus aegyptiacus]KAF6409955.1 glycoprotein VI platelet [Rousettus aegyptiacus]